MVVEKGGGRRRFAVEVGRGDGGAFGFRVQGVVAEAHCCSQRQGPKLWPDILAVT